MDNFFVGVVASAMPSVDRPLVSDTMLDKLGVHREVEEHVVDYKGDEDGRFTHVILQSGASVVSHPVRALSHCVPHACGFCSSCPGCNGGCGTCCPPFFSIQSGSAYCQLTSNGACVSDGSSNYGNNERCTIRAGTSLSVTATYFDTESGFDRISIGSTQWSGSSGPLSVLMNAGSVMTWYTDGSVARGGFTICGTAVSSS